MQQSAWLTAQLAEFEEWKQAQLRVPADHQPTEIDRSGEGRPAGARVRPDATPRVLPQPIHRPVVRRRVVRTTHHARERTAYDEELRHRIREYLDHRHASLRRVRRPLEWTTYPVPDWLRAHAPWLGEAQRLRVSAHDMRGLGTAAKVSAILALDSLWHMTPVPCPAVLEGLAIRQAARIDHTEPGHLAAVGARIVNAVVMPVVNPLVLTPARHVWTSEPARQTRAMSCAAARRLTQRDTQHLDRSLSPYLSTYTARFLRGVSVGTALATVGSAAASFVAACMGFHLHGIEVAPALTAGASWGAMDAYQRIIGVALRHRRQAILRRAPTRIGPKERLSRFLDHGDRGHEGHDHYGPLDVLPEDVPWWRVPFHFRPPTVAEARQAARRLVPDAEGVFRTNTELTRREQMARHFTRLVRSIKAGTLLEHQVPVDIGVDRARFRGSPMNIRIGLELEESPGALHVAEAANRLAEAVGAPVSVRAMRRLGSTAPIYQAETTAEARERREFRADHDHAYPHHGHEPHGQAERAQRGGRWANFRRRVGLVLAGTMLATPAVLTPATPVGPVDGENLGQPRPPVPTPTENHPTVLDQIKPASPDRTEIAAKSVETARAVTDEFRLTPQTSATQARLYESKLLGGADGAVRLHAAATQRGDTDAAKKAIDDALWCAWTYGWAESDHVGPHPRPELGRDVQDTVERWVRGELSDQYVSTVLQAAQHDIRVVPMNASTSIGLPAMGINLV